MSHVDPERMALVLVDALALGDKTAADKWGISTKTVERYRERAGSDPHVSALVQQKKAVCEAEWRTVRLRYLRRAIAKLDGMLDSATIEHMHAIVGAVKIIGELEVVTGALNVEQPGSDPARSGDAPRRGEEDTDPPPG